jgi:hypothetical protein
MLRFSLYAVTPPMQFTTFTAEQPGELVEGASLCALSLSKGDPSHCALSLSKGTDTDAS